MTITLTNEIRRILPSGVRRTAGFKTGDQVEVRASGGLVTLIPKLPPADDDYTPEQRRVVDARLREARKTPLYGPFRSDKELAAFLKTYKAEKTKSASPSKKR